MERDIEHADADLRIFFALVPDRGLQARLGVLALEFAARAGGRAVPAENIHMTLAFVGNVRAGEIPRLKAILATLPRIAFELTLDIAGTWNHAEVAWVGCRAAPQALHDLHHALSTALHDGGYPIEARPFHPHLTLARRCRRRVGSWSGEELPWRVRRISLMQSESIAGGVHYRELAHNALDRDGDRDLPG